MATALWSVNERLAGNPGLDIEPFDTGFAEDAVGALYATADALKEAREEMDEVRRQVRSRY